MRVELLRRYSNRPHITEPLVRLMALVASEPAAEPAPAPLASADRSRAPRRTIETALAADEVQAMIKAYSAGRKLTELAADYGVSDSTVKRLLRRHGVRRYRRRAA